MMLSTTTIINDVSVACDISDRSMPSQSNLNEEQISIQSDNSNNSVILVESNTFPKPQLKQTNAFHVSNGHGNDDNINNDGDINEKESGEYCPDYPLVEQFRTYSSIDNVKTVVNGFINNEFIDRFVPPEIADLCQQFYYQKEDGIFEIAYKLYNALRKVNRSTISKRMIKLFIRKYIKVQDIKKIDFYCDELIRLRYLVDIRGTDHGENNTTSNLLQYLQSSHSVSISNQPKVYKIPLEKTIHFDRYNKQQQSG